MGTSNFQIDSVNQSFASEAEKKARGLRADSLLQIITRQKSQRLTLKALDINHLYTNFGEQLSNDRAYQWELQDFGGRGGQMRPRQYLAAVELLSSAAAYEKSYQVNRFVRRSLNRGDSGNGIPRKVLQKSRNFLYSPSIRKIVKSQSAECRDSYTDSLLRNLPNTNFFKSLAHGLFRSNDRFHAFLYSTAYVASYLFGNLVGIFHRDSNPEKNANDLRPYLRPFDLVLMRSPNHLTNRFIPGYFGHVGIWMGNNLVERYLIKPFQKHSKNGAGMVEVLRSGVQISTLDDFADGEIFLVVRPVNLTRDQRKTILTNLRKQLTKDYDFNFDVESPEAITCTELVYLTYDYVDWRIRYTMERYTISPDDLVFTVLKTGQFVFKAYLKDGKVMVDPTSAFVESLVGDSGK